MHDVEGTLREAAALEREGNWAGAEATYGEVFRHAAAVQDVPAMVEAARAHARALCALSRLEPAEELAELSRALALGHGMHAAAARALNLLAAIHHTRGDLAGAHDRYSHALAEARDVGDDILVGFACMNLGVLANIRGELREARILYLESIASSLRANADDSAMMAYSNLGMVCTDLDECQEAELYFARGIEIAERLGDEGQIARLSANRAEALIGLEEMERARESLDRAETIASQIGQPATLGEVAFYRAKLARGEGDLDAAERFIDQALGMTGQGGLELLRAEALEERAHLRLAQERQADAHADLLLARSLYESLGAKRDAERAGALLISAPQD